MSVCLETKGTEATRAGRTEGPVALQYVYISCNGESFLVLFNFDWAHLPKGVVLYITATTMSERTLAFITKLNPLTVIMVYQMY